MKLSFSTLGCPGWSFDRVLQEAVADGYQGVEIRGIEGEMRPDRISCFLPENRAQTLTKARNAGVRLIGFGTSCSFHDPASHDKSIAEGKAAIDLAQAMGMDFIRVFGDKVAGDESEIIDRVAKGCEELCTFAKGTGVSVLQEVHGDFNLARRAAGVARAVNSPVFGLVWDVAHSDKTYGDGWEEFYIAIKPWIRHVHFKDHRREKGGTFALCETGKGDIPLPAIWKRLKNDGYSGYVSLEWEKAWHADLRDPEEEFPHFIRYIAEKDGQTA